MHIQVGYYKDYMREHINALENMICYRKFIILILRYILKHYMTR